MSDFKCEMCGGTVEFKDGDNVGICSSCGARQTLQNPENTTAPSPVSSCKKIDKKIIALIIAVAVIIALAAALIVISGKSKQQPQPQSQASDVSVSDVTEKNGGSAEESTVKTDDIIVEPTDADWQKLPQMFEGMILSPIESFDCEKNTAAEAVSIFYNYANIPLYETFFSDAEKFFDETYSSPAADPKGLFKAGYYSYSVDELNWMIKNILNVDPTDLNEAYSSGEDVSWLYKDNGRYYVNFNIFGEETGIEYKEISKKEIGDKKYEVTYEIYGVDYYSETPQKWYVGRNTLTVALKRADNRQFWSIYKMDYKFEPQY